MTLKYLLKQLEHLKVEAERILARKVRKCGTVDTQPATGKTYSFDFDQNGTTPLVQDSTNGGQVSIHLVTLNDTDGITFFCTCDADASDTYEREPSNFSLDDMLHIIDDITEA